MSAGKGDSPRPVNGDAFRDNYDEIFHKHKTQSTNKAQSESEYWKAEADRWREVALLQDAQIETIMAKLEHRMRKIESGIRELQ
jgi:hypothetical protein